ncbi:MAG: TetR/AcrR family transcriptional regulator C-terminal domain-containing protein [Acutalibacteraceae bacterium]
MADSNITKHALASALKELMEEVPFEKISVAHICEKCSMNRKSFYYHFKDKYDLVNWIFDTEFNDLTTVYSDDRWEYIGIVCDYFYENKNFYRKALRITGQNSFSEHFREYLHPLICIRVEKVLESKDIPQMYIDIFTDSIVCAMKRWLLDKECIPPEQFVSFLKIIMQGAATEVCCNMNKTKLNVH